MKLYFDTSALNKLCYDPDFYNIIETLILNHEPIVSVLNIAEIGANSDPHERRQLLDICKTLCRGYYLAASPEDILWRSLDSYLKAETQMVFTLKDKDKMLWNILNDSSLIDEDIRSQLIKWGEGQKEWFRNMNEFGRPRLQNVLSFLDRKEMNKIALNRSAFLKYLISNQQLLIDVMKDLLEPRFRESLLGSEIKIISDIESWRFYLGALALGIYNLSVQGNGYGHSRNAGSIDLKQSVYLTAVDVFITNDKPQRRVLRLLEPLGFTKRSIWSYSEFKTRISIDRLM